MRPQWLRRAFLGAIAVAFTGNGTEAPEPFSATIQATPVVGVVITATATGPNGNTSEFSRCMVTDTIFANCVE